MKNPTLYAKATTPTLQSLGQLIEFDVQLCPALLQCLESLKSDAFRPPGTAATPYLDELIAQQEALLMGIGTTLLNQNDRLYALLATSLRGTAYATGDPTPDGRVVYVPPIADLPPALAPASDGLQPAIARKLDRLAELLGNAPDGTPAPSDSLLVALRGTVEASSSRNVIDGLGGFSEEEKGELLSILGQILLAVL